MGKVEKASPWAADGGWFASFGVRGDDQPIAAHPRSMLVFTAARRGTELASSNTAPPAGLRAASFCPQRTHCPFPGPCRPCCWSSSSASAGTLQESSLSLPQKEREKDEAVLHFRVSVTTAARGRSPEQPWVARSSFSSVCASADQVPSIRFLQQENGFGGQTLPQGFLPSGEEVL